MDSIITSYEITNSSKKVRENHIKRIYDERNFLERYLYEISANNSTQKEIKAKMG
jgi:hypothetical protein